MREMPWRIYKVEQGSRCEYFARFVVGKQMREAIKDWARVQIYAQYEREKQTGSVKGLPIIRVKWLDRFDEQGLSEKDKAGLHRMVPTSLPFEEIFEEECPFTLNEQERTSLVDRWLSANKTELSKRLAQVKVRYFRVEVQQHGDIFELAPKFKN